GCGRHCSAGRAGARVLGRGDRGSAGTLIGHGSVSSTEYWVLSTQYRGVTAASLFSIAGPDGRDRGWRRRSARPQLFPDNGHIRRRLNAPAHRTSFNLPNGDNNAIANDEALALLAAKHQHGSL